MEEFSYNSITNEAQECISQFLGKNDLELLFIRLYNHVKSNKPDVVIRGKTNKIMGVSCQGERYLFYVVHNEDGFIIKFKNQSKMLFDSNNVSELVNLAENEAVRRESNPEEYAIGTRNPRKPNPEVANNNNELVVLTKKGKKEKKNDSDSNVTGTDTPNRTKPREEDQIKIGVVEIDTEPFFEKFDVNPEDYRNTEIKREYLSTRSYNCLIGSDIITLEELLKYSENDLSKIPQLGRKSRIEIVEWIQIYLSYGKKSEPGQQQPSSTNNTGSSQPRNSEISKRIRTEILNRIILAGFEPASQEVPLDSCVSFCNRLEEWGDHFISVIPKLDERNREIMRQRIFRNRTLQAVGEDFGLSRERIREICIRGEYRIRIRATRNPEKDVLTSLSELLDVITSPQKDSLYVCLNYAYSKRHNLCSFLFSFLFPKDEYETIFNRIMEAPEPFQEQAEIKKEKSGSFAKIPKELPAPTGRFCPKCGAELVIRLARRGAKAGQRFVGCSAFPHCWYYEGLSALDAETLEIKNKD